MKSVILCPGRRPGLEGLWERSPLANKPLFGKSVVEHWLEYLAANGAKQVKVIAPDRSQEVARRLGNGERWGIALEVVSEPRESKVEDARVRFRIKDGDTGWMAEPNDVILADCLPWDTQHTLFSSYADFFKALSKWMPHAKDEPHVGLHEIQPGVWAGLRTRIASTAKFCAPVWLGDHVHIEEGAVVGPNAIVENCAWVAAGAEVTDSYLGEETYLGPITHLNHSIALGATLIDWQKNSMTWIKDPFLLCNLRVPPLKKRIAEMLNSLMEPSQPKSQPVVPSYVPESGQPLGFQPGMQ
jgi:NDP-sugar pyrophosphorylase family protein